MALTAGGAGAAYRAGTYAVGSFSIRSGSGASILSKAAPTTAPAGTAVKTPVEQYTKNNCRKNLERLTGISPSGDKMHAHHVFPQKYETIFEKHGINIHEPQYMTWWEKTSHLKASRAYNEEWKLFFRKNHEADKAEILNQGKYLMLEYGIKTNY